MMRTSTVLLAALTVMCLAPSTMVQAALVTSSTDPSTIVQAALTYITGPIGIGLATLGLMVMLLQITRFGIAGLLVYVGIIAGIFGAGYIVNQLLGNGG
jgi:type IV secretory pathway VirB2 component (pilin)